MHFTLLTTHNRYETTTYFAQELRAALERGGAHVSHFRVEPDGGVALMKALKRFKPDWTLSFSDINCGGLSLGNVSGIPHFSYLLDPALFFLHHAKGPHTALSCVDRDDVARVAALGEAPSCFLPHAVAPLMQPPLPWAARAYDLVYFGTCLDLPGQSVRWESSDYRTFAPLLYALAKEVLTTPYSLWEVLENLTLSPSQMRFLSHEIDHYVRAYERVQFLKALPQKRLTIFGEGAWKEMLPEATVCSPLPFPALLDVMRHSRCVINSSSRFKQGYHERFFAALAQGTPVLSSWSGEIVRNYSETFCIPPGGWEQATEKVETITSQWEELVLMGQQRTAAAHTWDHRAATLLHFCTK